MSGPCAATNSATPRKASVTVSHRRQSGGTVRRTRIAGQGISDWGPARCKPNLYPGFFVILARSSLSGFGSGGRRGRASVWEGLPLLKGFLPCGLFSPGFLVGFDLSFHCCACLGFLDFLYGGGSIYGRVVYMPIPYLVSSPLPL